MEKIVIRQSILNQPWPILLALVVFLVPVSIYWFSPGVSQQADEPEIFGVLISMLITAIAMGVALSLKNEIVIEKEGVRYRYTPFLRKTRFLSTREVVTWDIVDYSFRNLRGFGYRRGSRGNGFYIMRKGKALRVTTYHKKTYFFGIEKAARVHQFIKQHWDLNGTN